MRRLVGTVALAYFRFRARAVDWLILHGDGLHRGMIRLAFLLLLIANFASPQAISPQDLETIRQQWEQRHRTEFWSNVIELVLAGLLSWIVWLLRTHWIQVLKTLWKYIKISFRVPVELVAMKEWGITAKEELIGGQQAIMANQVLLTARVNLLEEHGAIASFVADKDGNWMSVTRDLAELAGDHPYRLLKMDWKLRVEEESRERVVAGWLKSVRHVEPFSADFYFVSVAGKRQKVRMVAYQQLGPGGRPAGYVGQVFKIPATGEVPRLESD